MGTGAQGIYGLLANNPNILNATSRRLPDGLHLVEVISTRPGAAGARSGAAFIIEMRVVSGPLAGQKFSSVPKLEKSPEASTRELVQFCAACEGKSQDDFTNPVSRVVDGGTLAALIQRAFEATVGNPPQPANPYAGIRVFVRAEERTAKGSGFKFTRHEWSAATPALARQSGFEWPEVTPVAAEPGSAAPAPAMAAPAPAMAAPLTTAPGWGLPPAQPNLPGAGSASIAVRPMAPPAAPMMPPAPAMAPPAAPAAPSAPPAPVMAPPAPAAPPPAPAAPSGPRPVEGQAGWFHSVKFPGWWFAGPSEDAPTAYYDTATGTTHRY